MVGCRDADPRHSDFKDLTISQGKRHVVVYEEGDQIFVANCESRYPVSRTSCVDNKVGVVRSELREALRRRFDDRYFTDIWLRITSSDAWQGIPLDQMKIVLEEFNRLANRVTKITAGSDFNCAVLVSGKVKCWGSNGAGQLGTRRDGSAVGDNEVPGFIDYAGGLEKIIDIAAGDAHVCAKMPEGIKCWGANSAGQLGNGNRTQVRYSDLATFVDTGLEPSSMALSSDRTCIAKGLEVKSWGDGRFGVLGNGNINNIGDDELPSIVPSLKFQSSVSISVGSNHVCSWRAKDENKPGWVKCWGYGLRGQLGYGNKETVGDDETLDSLTAISGVEDFVKVYLGADHSCSVMADGRIKCWGSGSAGKLGYGSQIDIGDDETLDSVNSISVGDRVTKLALGSEHSCALLENLRVKCWGSGAGGATGSGSTQTLGDNETIANLPYVDVGDLVVNIVAGSRHTCAKTVKDEVRCWGASNSGQLGYGNLESIGDNETPANAGVVQLVFPFGQ